MGQKKLAVSLSGGGARSMAYLGVIDAWKAAGVEINYILAHSGAVILLCYCAGYADTQELISAYSGFSFRRFLPLTPRGISSGFLNSHKAVAFLEKVCNGAQIQELNPKTIVTVSNLSNYNRPKKQFLTKGSLAEAAVMSSSIPPLFPLYRKDGKKFGDGAFTSLYSAAKLRSLGAEVVVGMFPDALTYTRLPWISQDMSRVMRSLIGLATKTELETEPVDLTVHDFEAKVGLYDYSRAREAYNAGYKKGQKTLKQVMALVTP